MLQNENFSLSRFTGACASSALFLVFALFLLLVFSGKGEAQSIEQLQQLQQLQKGQSSSPAAVPPQPDVVLQPTSTSVPGTSELEEALSRRANERLRQFGYNVMGVGRSVTVPQVGAVQDDYVLGPGDEIVVSLRGQENNEVRAYVDRDGRVIFPRLNPISATGRTFGSFRADVEAAVHRAYVATAAFVSIGRVRQISVLVTGEVNQPGQRIVTGLSSVMDALSISGGVKKSGSLRNISVIRGAHSFNVDLYAYLGVEGRATNLRLADGDRIAVPQLGKTVAITGVRRPGIYELPAGRSTISEAELLRLGQGEMIRGAYRASLLQIAPDGRQQFVDVTGQPARQIRDGEILAVNPTVDEAVGRISLRGAVRIPGDFALDRTPTLQDLLPSTDVFASTPEPYMLFGVIQRVNTLQLRRETIPFSPLWVLQKKANVKLQSNDVVRILTVCEMRQLATPRSGNDRRNLGGNCQDESKKRDNIETDRNKARSAGNRQANGNQTNGDNTADSSPLDGDNSAKANGDVPNKLPDGTDVNQAMMAAQTMLNGQNSNGTNGTSITRGGSTSQVGGEVGSGNGAVAGTQLGGLGRSQTDAANFSSEGGGVGRSGDAGDASANTNSSTNTNGSGGELGSGLSALENAFIGKEYRVDVSGALHDPGAFLIMPGTTLAQIIDAARGLDSDADLTHIEVTSTDIDNSTGYSTTQRRVIQLPQRNLDAVIVKPLDQILFRHVFSDLTEGSVTLRGEVRYPGTYKLLRGEHLSSVIARAGGLTSVAYPYGTVFLRVSAATAEREGHRRAAQDMDEQLLSATTRQGADRVSMESLDSLHSFVEEIRNQPALGRVSIVADPSVLAARPQLDPLMEPGDSITVPPRPNTIAVLGQVMQQGSYPYASGQKAADYIARAGGYGRFSDDDNVFIVLPDGSARKMTTSSLFGFDETTLPPGSTIVVPRDVTPFNLRQTVIDVSQIFSQLAVSMASLLVISKQ